MISFCFFQDYGWRSESIIDKVNQYLIKNPSRYRFYLLFKILTGFNIFQSNNAICFNSSTRLNLFINNDFVFSSKAEVTRFQRLVIISKNTIYKYIIEVFNIHKSTKTFSSDRS